MANFPAVYVVPHPAAGNVDELLQELQQTLPETKFILVQPNAKGELTNYDKNLIIEKAEILYGLTMTICEFMFTAKRLKWAQSMGAGMDRLFTHLEEVKKIPTITVTRSGGASAEAISEYVMGQIYAWERRFSLLHDNQKLKKWDRTAFTASACRKVSSLRIGILGAGYIGTAIGNKCKANGMEVWTLSRGPREDNPFDKHMTAENLDTLLENCDYVCSVLPSTPKTRGLLSGDVLQHCQNKKSVLINIGRGDVIDEESIIKSIRNKWIGGGIFDVFPKEPLPENCELWDLPNFVITPHVSYSGPRDTYARHFAENYKNYVEGKPLKDVIDWTKGY